MGNHVPTSQHARIRAVDPFWVLAWSTLAPAVRARCTAAILPSRAASSSSVSTGVGIVGPCPSRTRGQTLHPAKGPFKSMRTVASHDVGRLMLRPSRQAVQHRFQGPCRWRKKGKAGRVGRQAGGMRGQVLWRGWVYKLGKEGL